MIGVTQDKRGINILEVFGRESLDRRLRAHRREDRRDKVAVRRVENPRAGEVVFSGDGKLEHAGIISDT